MSNKIYVVTRTSVQPMGMGMGIIDDTEIPVWCVGYGTDRHATEKKAQEIQKLVKESTGLIVTFTITEVEEF